MKLAARDIAAFMAQPEKQAGVLIYGPDYGQISQRADEIGKKVLAGAVDDPFSRTDLTQEQLLDDTARLSDELNAMSLMGGRRLITLRGVTDSVADIIKEALEGCSRKYAPHEQHFLLVTAAELTPRSALRLLFEQAQTVAALPCYREETQGLSQFIRHKFDSKKLRYPPEAIAFLAAQLAGDRMVAESELNKILLYYEGDSQIEMDTLRLLITSASEIEMDSICHAFAGGQLSILMQHLDSALLSGLQPIVLLRSLDRLLSRIEQMARLIADGKSADQALSALRPPVFFKDKPRYHDYARRWNLPRLQNAKHQLLRLDRHIKRHHEIDDLLLKDTLLRLAAAGSSKAAA